MNSLAVSRRLSGPLALLVLSFLVQGCATEPAVMANYTRPAQEPLFELLDQRTEEERTTKWMSDYNRACSYTVRQFGDEATSPDRITLLRDSLDAMLHTELMGKTLLVTHYGIYLNSSGRARFPNNGIGGNALQGWIKAAMEIHVEHGCRDEEITEGWLEPVKTRHSPVIIQITVSLDGRTYYVRSFFSPDREIGIDLGTPEATAAIFGAVKKATDQLVAELRSH